MTDLALLTLGCPKNLVDSERMITLLREAGFKIKEGPADAEVVIVNTCSFIEDAKQESIDTILEIADLKKTGRLKYLLIAGCLAQRYPRLLERGELPEVDGLLGCRDYLKVVPAVEGILAGRRVRLVSKNVSLPPSLPARTLITPRHYAYLKVSEGCDNRCNYCIIPYLRGPYQSRPPDAIVEEAKRLIRQGTVELNLISQDLAAYGRDRPRRLGLSGLLSRLLRLKGVGWLRLLYCHPAHLEDEVISLIRDEKRVARYLDLPIQHISEKMLKSMGRRITKKEIIRLIARLRREIPEIALRTTVMLGFPGEDEDDFSQLLDFIREVRFEHLGAFTYSREEGTPACRFSEQIPEAVKAARLEEIMLTQQEIVLDANRRWQGKEMEVLIDGVDPGDRGLLIGRSEAFAPEVDGVVFVRVEAAESRKKVGRFLKVRIEGIAGYDLVGEEIR